MIYLILFQTHLFSSSALNILNHYILHTKAIQVDGELDGALFGAELSIRHAELIVAGDTLFKADNIQVLKWEWDWVFKELIVSDLSVSDFKLNIQYVNNLILRESKSSKALTLILNHISGINGKIAISLGDSLQIIEIQDFVADVWLIDGITQLKLSSASVFIPGQISDTLHLGALVELNDQGTIEVNSLKIEAEGKELNLQGKFSQGHYSATLNGKNIRPDIFDKLKIPDPLSDMTLDMTLNLDMNEDRLKLSGIGDIVLNQQRLPFQLRTYLKEASGETVKLQFGTPKNRMDLMASRDPSGVIVGDAELFLFDIASYFPSKRLQISEPVGNISFHGDHNKYYISPRLSSFRFNSLPLDSLNVDIEAVPTGELVLSNGTITQDQNRMNYSGLISEEGLDLSGNIEFSDFSFVHRISPNSRISGSVSSSFNISGNLQEPHIVGTLTPDSLTYKGLLSLTGLGKVDFQYKNGEWGGELALIGKKGFILGDSLKSYTILANMSEAGYFLQDLHIQGSKNMISMSGDYGPDGIDLYKLNIIMDSNQLKIPDRVHIQRNDNQEFYIPETVLNLNKGGISLNGAYSVESGLNIDSQFELIDLKQVLQFIHVKQDFSGLASGRAHLSGKLFDPVIQINLNLRDGVTLGYPSDSARINITLSSSEILSNEIEAFTNNGSLRLKGLLPWGYKVKGSEVGTTPQNISVTLNNYRLTDLKFSSVVGFPISGRATGSITIRGNPEDSKLDGQLSLVEASFDTLQITKAYADFNYEGNLLTFDSLSMVSTWGYGSGVGFIPIALDLIAQDRMRAANRDMGLDFNFILNEMPFLSSYISTIDAIRGDFNGKFGLSGPLTAPIRNGHIRGHNARLEVSVLGNPITDVHSEISLIDNTLTIDHFSGRMLFSEGSNLKVQGVVGYLASNFGELLGVKARQDYAGVVTANGSIDLQSFFEPRFNVKLQANEIYYRSTDGLIEAIADADMQVLGQDTLDVTAIIPVKRAAYYSNFEYEESYEQLVSATESSLFRYSLDAQFASDLLISNDQMEAEFEGELWLLDYGDGIMRFTGTLTVLQGGKFYYVGNELSLLSGEIIFNSVDFNPQINMEAEIDIEGERVRLILSGDLNEPELVINAENTKLTQSDVLTYLTINQKLAEVGFDRDSALDPVKTYSEMLVEKQLSKIGRDIIGLDILEVGINLGRGDTTTVSRFQVGQRLSKNLKITAAGDLQPTDGKTDYDFGLEYQINQNVSVTSKVNQNGEVELNARLKFTY
ncbi:MAG: translocation/assembly module TamB domain-containing protein [Candidatus Marinimicrobia bacterium]|nr:translocation/assembly module TamB domain-containing protein [Candidatus Neomarinimicrobiota bacterium]